MLDIQMVDRDNIIPFSWITNGQRVPEDLLTATPELVAELITNSPCEIDLNQWGSESNPDERDKCLSPNIFL
jgi:flagellar biosynthesis GTPase FlhF